MNNRISSNFTGQQRPLSEINKKRILRHHSKIMTAKKKRNDKTEICASDLAPSPQLVVALRRIYEKPGGGDPQLPASFRSLLDSVSNHPSFSAIGRSSADKFGSPTSMIEATETTENSVTGTNDSKEAVYALESLIAYLCKESSTSSSLSFSPTLKHGLLITILSLLMEYVNSNEVDLYSITHKNQEASTERNLQDREGQRHNVTDDPTIAPPLQVGSIISLLRTDSDNDHSNSEHHSENNDLLSYFGQAAAVYEERIEIQKARLRDTYPWK